MLFGPHEYIPWKKSQGQKQPRNRKICRNGHVLFIYLRWDLFCWSGFRRSGDVPIAPASTTLIEVSRFLAWERRPISAIIISQMVGFAGFDGLGGEGGSAPSELFRFPKTLIFLMSKSSHIEEGWCKIILRGLPGTYGESKSLSKLTACHDCEP